MTKKEKRFTDNYKDLLNLKIDRWLKKNPNIEVIETKFETERYEDFPVGHVYGVENNREVREDEMIERRRVIARAIYSIKE